MSKDAPEYGSGPGEIPYRLPWRIVRRPHRRAPQQA